jgi:protein-disulfide isomerase
MEQKHTIPLAILAAGVLIAGAIYFGGNSGSYVAKKKVDTASAASITLPKVTEKDHLYGDPNAQIIIVEYSDIECPFCKVFHGTMKEVVDSYGGKVAWVYRHFPIPQLHSKAIKEAEATECAAEQGGNTIFWKYLGKALEATKSNDTMDLAELPKIAGELGLNVESFNECLSSGKYTSFVEKSMDDAVKAGARGTPYSIILTKDGKKVVINGADPLASVKVKIDSLLK